MTLTEERLDAAFSALADPTRRAIIARLSEGEATVKELAEPFPISLQAVSKHIRVLERAGLISQGVDAQRRPCRIETDTADELVNWITEQKQRWEGRLDALEAHLDQVQTKESNELAHPQTGTIDEASSPSLAYSTRPGISSGRPSPSLSISRRSGVDSESACLSIPSPWTFVQGAASS